MPSADPDLGNDEPAVVRTSARKARILFVENDAGDIGGSTRALLSLVRHLDRDRFQAIVTFSRGSNNPAIPGFEALGCEILRVGARQARRPSGRLGLGTAVWLMLRRPWVDIGRAFALRAAIGRLHIDLVHTNNNLRVSRCGIWAAALTRRPLVAHQRYRFNLRRLDVLGSRLIDRLICISEYVRDELAGRVSPSVAQVIYDGVDVPRELPVRAERGGHRRVAAVGRLVPWKGQHVLIEAAAAVLRKVPDVHFLLVGGSPLDGNDDYEHELRARAIELGIDAHVDFVGHVFDIERRIRDEFDVVVHTSVDPEPFGLVVAEAMALGCPVIASDAGGPAEIVEHGRSGLLFPAGSAEQLAHQLVRLLTEPDLASTLRSAAFVRVSERFDARRTAAEVMACYDELLGDELLGDELPGMESNS